jgi:WhiB family redox-sensing transcriptional regulator
MTAVGAHYPLAERDIPPVLAYDDRACNGEDPNLFFPDRGVDAGPAKAICHRCHCRAECLAWAVRTRQEFGVWGGTTPEERRRLRRTGKAT